MRLTNAYTMPCPSDMKVISEPGIPRAVSLTFQFEDAVHSIVIGHGTESTKIAQQLRQFANELDEL